MYVANEILEMQRYIDILSYCDTTLLGSDTVLIHIYIGRINIIIYIYRIS